MSWGGSVCACGDRVDRHGSCLRAAGSGKPDRRAGLAVWSGIAMGLGGGRLLAAVEAGIGVQVGSELVW